MSPSFLNSDADASGQEPLAQGYWVRMIDGMDRLQASMDLLMTRSEAGESQVEALFRHLTDPARDQAAHESLADLLAGQAAGQEQWQAILDGLNELAESVAKLNRTQYKSNALAEMKDQRVSTALGALQDVAARREQTQEERAHLQQDRLAAMRSAERGAFAADLLPALDGLELALDSGRTLLARCRAQEAEAMQAYSAQGPAPGSQPRVPGFWQRLAWALRGRGLPPGSSAPAGTALSLALDREMGNSLEAWLKGIDLVRVRFLGLLATAGIHPIEAQGRPFDPREHLAMATEARPDLPDGVVVAILRQGYRQRDRVIRYAEVAVNRVGATGAGTAAGINIENGSEPSIGSGSSQP